jgi:protein TonB
VGAEQRSPAGATDQSQTQLRLVLAGSIALLLHVIVAASLGLQPAEIAPERTVQLQLISQGTKSSASEQSDAAAQAHASISQRAAVPPQAEPRPDADDGLSDRTVPAEVTTTGDSERAVTEARTSRSPKPEETQSAGTRLPLDEPPKKLEADPSPATPEPMNAASKPAASSMTGAPSGASGLPFDAIEKDLAPQRSSQPDHPEMDPYLLALSRHMLQPLKRVLRHGPTLTHFNKALETGARPITIELRLLSNGAVRRVRLTESSGSDVVDRIAVQSALAASPYPPPPEKERANGFRFQLDLVMSPVYL